MTRKPTAERPGSNRPGLRLLAGALALGCLLAWTPARGWDRGVKARRHVRAGDRSLNARAYREAMTHYQKYLEGSAGVERDRETVAHVHDRMAECAEKSGRYARSLDALARALTCYLDSGNAVETARTVLRMGEGNAYLGNFDEAARLIELARQLPGSASDRTIQAEALRVLAIVQGATGQYGPQKQSAEGSLAIYRELNDEAGQASALTALAHYHRSQGAFDKALKIAGQALETARRSTPRDLAPVQLALASIHRARGDVKEAIRTDEEALDAALESGVQEAAAVARNYLGLDHMAFGEADPAREALEASQAFFTGTGAVDDEARLHVDLGRLDYMEGDYRSAAEHLGKALEQYRKTGQPVGEGIAESGLGRVLLARGEAGRSLESHERALAAFGKAGDKTGVAAESVNKSFALVALGRYDEAMAGFRAAPAMKGEADLAWRAAQGRGLVLQARGDTDGALAAYREALELIDQMMIRSRVPEFRASFLAGVERFRVYDEAIDLLAAKGRAVEAFELSERGKARAIVDLVAGRAIGLKAGVASDLLTQEKELAEQILDLSQKMSGQGAPLALRGAGPGPMEQKLAELRSERHRVLERIAAESPQLASLVSVAPLGAKALQSKLGPDEQMLCYYVGDRKAHLFLLDRQGVTYVPLSVGIDELHTAVEVARINLDQQIPDLSRLRELYEALIAPAAPRLRASRLVVVPHGVLHYLPFQALLDAKGHYLIERFPISYSPSADTLAVIGQARPGAAAPLLALGNPTSGVAESALPHAEDEVKRVSGRFPGSTALTGAAATEAAFKHQAQRYRILHLACHGRLDPKLPLNSGLSLAPGGGEDGRLEVHEIFGLDLKADLTVLSGCQTALGQVTRGDELVCLARSFLHSGSRSVLASLWTVPDESTALLMERFYERLAAGSRRDQALQEASLAMLADAGHSAPYQWAAFCLTGRVD